MGEVAIRGGNGMEFQVREGLQVAQILEENKNAGDKGISSAVVMWEMLVPKMVVRVLLVEADDSTRQIIAALLRKCSYRVVAVPDGLKAWEFLRGRPSNIDLILTEVDLPLISGYALLTLIMDHEVCKNIPVIMMSSHDSVCTVFKCMSRGATDFLVKPIRKNELRNLWQHVWRKQASSSAGGLGPPDESVVQKKDEAGTENNAAASDKDSSHCMECAHRSRESMKKGSEAQSSCTKPDSGDGDAENFHGPSQPESPQCSDAYTGKNRRCEGESLQLGNAMENSINLIGGFDSHLIVGVGACASNTCSRKLDSEPPLDLSLRRSDQSDHKLPRLNHSEASPFSRYINKVVQPKDHATVSYHYIEYIPEMQEHAFQIGEAEATLSNSPDRGIRYENNAANEICASQVAQIDSCLLSSNCRNPSSPRNNGNSVDLIDNTSKNSDTLETEAPEKNTCPVNTGTINSVPGISPPPECGNEEGYRVHDRDLQRSLQREAALTKFRLKRKDRCFEKKVRYESRKKLAEQRPRVKGQFVRQVADEAQPQKLSAGY